MNIIRIYGPKLLTLSPSSPPLLFKFLFNASHSTDFPALIPTKQIPAHPIPSHPSPLQPISKSKPPSLTTHLHNPNEDPPPHPIFQHTNPPTSTSPCPPLHKTLSTHPRYQIFPPRCIRTPLLRRIQDHLTYNPTSPSANSEVVF